MAGDTDEMAEFAHLVGDAERLGVYRSLPVARSSSVDQDGRTISALRWGERPSPLVFLHGAGLQAHTWDSVALVLGRPALALDLPGHGDSDWRDDLDYRPLVIARSLADVLPTLVGDDVTLVGQSMGGLTAIALLPLLPAVRRLVLVDILPSRKDGAPGAARMHGLFDSRDGFDSMDALVDRAIELGFPQTREHLQRSFGLNTKRTSDGRIRLKHHFASMPEGAIMPPFSAAELWRPLTDAAVPVMLVRGDRGVVDDEQIAQFRTRFPTSRVETVHAGHNVQSDAPSDLAELIEDFERDAN